MDVERIQKINNMAVELMKQGLATSREEAVEQAEKMFRNQDTGGFSQVRETMQEIKEEREEDNAEQVAQDTHSANAQENQGNSDLAPEKVKHILKQNTDFLVRTIREFQEKIHNLEKQVASLKTSLDRQQLPTVNDVLTSSRTERQTQVEVQALESGAREIPAGEATVKNPRQGDYSSSDVSVEKFFYMGSK